MTKDREGGGRLCQATGLFLEAGLLFLCVCVCVSERSEGVCVGEVGGGGCHTRLHPQTGCRLDY